MNEPLSSGDETTIGKALSGFANVAGGVLILGVATRRDDVDGDKLAPATEQRYLADAIAVRKRLEDRFGSLTTPPIGGVAIAEILDLENSGRGIVAVCVPESDGKPHEGPGCRYFMRTHTNTQPMPYAILSALFGRSPAPRLKLSVTWGMVLNGPAFGLVRVNIQNSGRGTALDVVVQFDWLAHSNGQHLQLDTSNPTLRRITPAPPHVHDIVSPEITSLHPGMVTHVCDFSVLALYGHSPPRARLVAALFASNMQPVSVDEVLSLEEDGASLLLPRD